MLHQSRVKGPNGLALRLPLQYPMAHGTRTWRKRINRKACAIPPESLPAMLQQCERQTSGPASRA
jgi:hypothetical protein